LYHHPVPRVVVRRLLMAIPLLVIVSGLSFLLVSLTPGDAARDILGPNAPPDVYVKLRRSLGLDLPLWDQYGHWLRHAVTGNLGTSLFTGQPVSQAINERLPVTISLIVGALLVTVIVGVPLGILSAVRGNAVGRMVDGFALIGFALPPFWLGAELIALFAVKFTWFPASGFVSISQSPLQWLHSLVLPVVALGLVSVAAVAKQTREAMLDVLGSEYIRMAWANGISARSIYFRHALKNASIRVITVVGLIAVQLLGGTIFVESVFSLPGLGSLVVDTTISHDLPVVQGVAVYFTIMVVLINLIIDLAYTWLNPRVRIR
jgi:peptide/nickel transport system permease protein